ncbi:hypothetical protein Q9295_06265 [Xinfangfangia sp. CPCC 101601]|uniref:Peptidase C-terminal archaeal/bacterial domain-containing protein n=1 Tax=Pseudogemmobacter lacusdianii TaxID=3069608 RepID=A0ABU0VWT2_9RHOB|nr:hypothetical protein [Xinfangfangia sp. CPCC 101601]MDQ2065968.1 hypothetical protein [Xinfangfangia sp. CPCC 101601]
MPNSLSLAFTTTALVALAAPVFAQDKTGSNLTTSGEGAAGAAATLSMGYELYAIGTEAKDPVTVLAAAKLVASAEVEAKTPAALEGAAVAGAAEAAEELTLDGFAATRKAADAAPEAPAALASDAERPAAVASFKTGLNEEEGDAEAPATAAQMFAKAAELAGDDAALQEIIEDAQAETSRGRIGGGVSWLSKLNSGKIDIWEVPFYGNSYAEVAVVGDGDANLDVIITDANGNVICYDTSPSDQVYCDFVPAWDGYFYVAVENAGRKRNSYYLMTN